MPTGETLLLKGQYREAIERLKIDVPRDTNDGFGSGAKLLLGIAYLCDEQLSEAERVFQELLKESTYRVSDHYIYTGMVRWFDGRIGEAVGYWKNGLKSHYARDRGMDVPLLLFYAAVREPSAFDCAHAEDLIRKKLKVLDPEDLPYATGRYLLNEIDEPELRRMATDITGRAVPARKARRLAQAEFYIGTQALRSGDREAFRSSIERASKRKGFNQVFHELFLIRWEAARASASTGKKPRKRSAR